MEIFLTRKNICVHQYLPLAKVHFRHTESLDKSYLGNWVIIFVPLIAIPFLYQILYHTWNIYELCNYIQHILFLIVYVLSQYALFS